MRFQLIFHENFKKYFSISKCLNLFLNNYSVCWLANLANSVINAIRPIFLDPPLTDENNVFTSVSPYDLFNCEFNFKTILSASNTSISPDRSQSIMWKISPAAAATPAPSPDDGEDKDAPASRSRILLAKSCALYSGKPSVSKLTNENLSKFPSSS